MSWLDRFRNEETIRQREMKKDSTDRVVPPKPRKALVADKGDPPTKLRPKAPRSVLNGVAELSDRIDQVNTDAKATWKTDSTVATWRNACTSVPDLWHHEWQRGVVKEVDSDE